jgi:hypothetical protein
MPAGSIEYAVIVGTEKQLESPSGALPDPKAKKWNEQQAC